MSFNPNFPSAIMQQWNFNIQRQLPGGILLETGYVGSNSVKLLVGRKGRYHRMAEIRNPAGESGRLLFVSAI